MKLLERDWALKELTDCLSEAAKGRGRIALVHGEAGIGKTKLVESFIASQCSGKRVLIGRCDALSTPEPLGPLYDIAQKTQGTLLRLLQTSDNRLAIFSELLRELQENKIPTVLVFEDVHWADDATLDLLRYLSRRIGDSPVLIIFTYRDDEIATNHRLYSLLGILPPGTTKRIHLEALSREAVGQLAGDERESNRLHALTRGNPFFVSELLANPHNSVPATVREAILARAAQLSSGARAILEFCSVVPGRVETWLLGDLFNAADFERCLMTGLIALESDEITFRHELAREAIESSLSLPRLTSLHEEVLRRLLEREGGAISTARLVYHASRARNLEVVRHRAPVAAKEAAALGAHRQAAAHYQMSLDHVDPADQEAHASLLEASSHECYLIDQLEKAISLCQEALQIRKAQGNLLKSGDDMRRLSRFYWFRGQSDAARKLAMGAIELLERLPPGPEIAMAYSNMAQLKMLSEDYLEAVQWGSKAFDLAERRGFTETLVHSLNSLGTAEFYLGKPEGAAKIERSLALAHAHDMHDHAARAYSNLISDALKVRNYPRAEALLSEGLAYTRERDLDRGTLYQLAMRSRLKLETGLWKDAEADATNVLSAGQSVARIDAIIVLACLRLRQGDPQAAELLEESRKLALAAGEVQRIAPMAAARAEAAWLRGDAQQIEQELEPAFNLAQKYPDPWRLGELCLWLWRGGVLGKTPAEVAEPYRLEILGDWRSAAEAWQGIGCPYEQALALAGGDHDARLQALEILFRLGAGPAAAVVRRSLRAEGVKSLPRGPRVATQQNPSGLTGRQVEILLLLTENLSNKEIAGRLRIAPKTVDHHVVAIMAKLNVSSRKEAAKHVVTVGLLAKDRGSRKPK